MFSKPLASVSSLGSTEPFEPSTPPTSPSLGPRRLDTTSPPPHVCRGDRIVPTFFRPWDGFGAGQDARIDSIHTHLPPGTKVLRQVCLTERQSSITSELNNTYPGATSVQSFFHYTTEAPVAHVLKTLNIPGRESSNFLGGVSFQPAMRTITASILCPGKRIEEIEQRTILLNPNQAGVYRINEKGLSMTSPICINQYHSPDELSVSHLRAGLTSLGKRQEPITSADLGLLMPAPEGTSWTDSERKTLSALTHVYNIMVRSGLSFGFVTTGQALVFLTLDWDSPGTLFFSLMCPTILDFKLQDGRYISHSAAAPQCLAFFLLALSEVYLRESNAIVDKPRGWHSTYPFTRVCESIMVGSEADHDHVAASYHTSRLTPLPPPPASAPTYPLSARIKFPLRRSPKFLNELFTYPAPPLLWSILDRRWPHNKRPGYNSWTPSNTINARSFQSIDESYPSLPPATKTDAMWVACPLPQLRREPRLLPWTLCALWLRIGFFLDLPPLDYDVSELYPPERLSKLETVQPVPRHPLSPDTIVRTPLGQVIQPDLGQQEMLKGLGHFQHLLSSPLSPPPRQQDEVHLADTRTQHGPLIGQRCMFSRHQHQLMFLNNQLELQRRELELRDLEMNTNKRKVQQPMDCAPPPKRQHLLVESSTQAVRGSDNKSSDSRTGFGYCTHLCLLSLMRGLDVDPLCPNVVNHRRMDPADQTHLINLDDFLHIVVNNLHRGAETVSERISDNAFRMTLSGYNYTFVCKRFRGDLDSVDHESAVYERLRMFQGKYIPVFLGRIYLQRHLINQRRTLVIRYSVMSFAGASLLDGAEIGVGKRKLAAKAEKVIRAFHRQGVTHTASLEHLFYNIPWGDVVFVGLGRSQIFEGLIGLPDQTSQTGALILMRGRDGDTYHLEDEDGEDYEDYEDYEDDEADERDERGELHQHAPPVGEQPQIITGSDGLSAEALTNKVLGDIYNVRRIFR